MNYDSPTTNTSVKWKVVMKNEESQQLALAWLSTGRRFMVKILAGKKLRAQALHSLLL